MKQLFIGHLPTKIAALTLAILTYSYLLNRAKQTSDEILRISLDQVRPGESQIVIGAGDDAILRLEDPANTVRVQIEGIQTEVDRVIDRGIIGHVDLSRFVPADGQPAAKVPLSPDDITFRNVPPSVTLNYQDRLPVVLVSRKRTWTVPLRVLANEIQTLPRFQVTGYSVQPDQIQVTGPSELRRSLTLLEIPAERLEILQPDKSFEQTFLRRHLAALINEKNVEILGNPSVLVKVDVQPIPEIRELELPHGLIVTTTVDESSGNPVSVFVSNLRITLDATGRTLTNNRLRVTLRGPRYQLDKIQAEPERYRVVFDLTEFLNQLNQTAIDTVRGTIINLPSGVTLDPVRVNISYEP